MKENNRETFDNLAVELKNGDKNALSQLFNSLKQDIYFFSYSYFRNNELAEEVVQDVFVRLWEKRSLIDPALSIKNYILRIAKNIILDQLRRHAFEIRYINETQVFTPSCHEDTEDHVIFADYLFLADKAIELLPPKRKNIFKLSREQNMSYFEISRELNISVNVVENQMSKALKHIREYLVTHADIALAIAFFIFS